MSLLDQIRTKLAELEYELVRALIVPEREMDHALVLARRLDGASHAVWRAASERGEWRGMTGGQYDMSLEEAEAHFELRAAESSSFATNRLRKVDRRMSYACDLLLTLPPTEWRKYVDARSDQVRLVKDLEGIVEQATRLATFVEASMQGLSHETAVAMQNRAAAKVRRVLGYDAPPPKLEF